MDVFKARAAAMFRPSIPGKAMSATPLRLMEPCKQRGIIESVSQVPGPQIMRTFLLLLAFASMATGGCQREERELRLDPPMAAALDRIALMQNGISGAPPALYFALDKDH